MAIAYLRPRSVDLPPQGSFRYHPEVRLVEATSPSGLEALLNPEFTSQGTDPDNFYVIEDIKYQVIPSSPDDLYSALVFYYRVEKV